MSSKNISDCVGRVYKHYKSKGCYVIIAIAYDEHCGYKGIPKVVYRPCAYNYKYAWIRDYAEFFGNIEHEGTTHKRFSEVKTFSCQSYNRE